MGTSRMLPPARVEPDKVYGRNAAAAYAGVSTATIRNWENGFGRTNSERDDTCMMEPDIDWGYIDYGMVKYKNRGTLHHRVSSFYKWYSKVTLAFLATRARENVILQRRGYWRLSQHPCPDPDLRERLLTDLSDAEWSFLNREAPFLEEQPRLRRERAPRVLDPSTEADWEAARALAARLRKEELDRETARATAEQLETLRSLSGFTPREQALVRHFLTGEPVPDAVGGPETPKPPRPEPRVPYAVRMQAHRERKAAEAAEAARFAERAKIEKLAAWKARVLFIGPLEAEVPSRAS